MNTAVRDVRRPPAPPPHSRQPENGGHGRDGAGAPTPSPRIAAWAVVGSITMLFFGLVSALIGRRGGLDWGAVAPPSALWVATAAIAGSSVALEVARRALASGRRAAFLAALQGTAALGVGFLAAQLVAWRTLAAAGVFLVSSPHSAYVYLLTGVHGVHLAGGLIALAVVLWRAVRGAYHAGDRGGVDAFAIYWHFLGLLWFLLFAVLFAA